MAWCQFLTLFHFDNISSFFETHLGMELRQNFRNVINSHNIALI